MSLLKKIMAKKNQRPKLTPFKLANKRPDLFEYFMNNELVSEPNLSK